MPAITAWRWRRSPGHWRTKMIGITGQERADMLALAMTIALVTDRPCNFAQTAYTSSRPWHR